MDDIRTLCTHQFSAHRRCGSPALRGQELCYYHHPSRRPAQNIHLRRSRRLERKSITLPLPISRTELNHSLLYLIHLIAANEIDTRRADLLLNALQTAAHTLPQ